MGGQGKHLLSNTKSLQGCRRCPARKWKQIVRPQKSPHKCATVRIQIIGLLLMQNLLEFKFAQFVLAMIASALRTELGHDKHKRLHF